MDDRTLLRVALIASFIGLGGLLWFSSSVTQPELPPHLLQEKESAYVEGTITSSRASGGNLFVTLRGEYELPLFIYHSDLSLEEGDTVKAWGELSHFNGEPELMVDKLEKQ